MDKVYVVVFRDPYTAGDQPVELRSAWFGKTAAETAMENEQRKVSSIGWQHVRGYEVVEVPFEPGTL